MRRDRPQFPLWTALISATFFFVGSPSGYADDQALAAAPDSAPYKVVDGDKVDDNTLNGWRTWRAAGCDRCHGAQQQGLVGPSLVDSLKVLTKDQFKTTVTNGRPEKGMPNWSGSKQVMDNLDNLYAFLKGRSDGAIKPGHLHPIEVAK